MTNKEDHLKKYTRVYYRLSHVLENEPSRKDEQGWTIEEHRPRESTLKKMVQVMREEGIEDKDDMLAFVMQSCKGQSNPRIVEEMLSKL